MDEGETITWQEQAEIFQTMLESALEYQRGLEEEIRNLVWSLQYAEGEWCKLEQEHKTCEAALRQRDQVITDQAKEIANISHILQIQQRLLRTRKLNAK